MLHHDPIYRPTATQLKILSTSFMSVLSATDEERDHHQTILALSERIRVLENENSRLKSKK